MEIYSHLSRAQLSFDYLHTNSTTHEFLFGALAELIDNSRDAGATELDIFTVKDPALRGGFMLYFIDNGCGMSPEEAKNVIVFGKSFKRSADACSIGMYGNGLKSGSMRIGNDMILFTKRDSVYSCVFLSRTFHEAEKLEEVIVPLPSFRSNDKTANVATLEEQKKHDIELQIILKYSPFRCMKDIFSQFDRIKGESGTLVIIYNMKLLDNGSTELDVTTDVRDILLTAISERDDSIDLHADIELPPERRSLRAYVSTLYADPRMKVYIQSRKVQTKRLLDTLYAVKRYNFASKTFRTRAELDLAKAKNDVKVAELRAREAESKARDCEIRHADSKDPEHLKLIRRLNNAASEVRSVVAVKQNTVARKQKALKDPKTITFYFGMNVVNRACDGMFVYNCSRLIKMYQRIGPQQDSSMMCRGVVGIVDVPYMVLEPTHNKQDFADAKEFRQLMRSMADHLMQYWDDLAIDRNGGEDIDRFWKSFGYLSARWRDPPSDEEKYARKRYSCVSLCVQCDNCLKWRVLPYSQSQIGRDVPDNWQCRDNPDQKHRRCDTPEEDMSVPIGVLKRKIKTKEQRQAELEAQIRKKQEELEQIIDPEDEPSSLRNRAALGKRPSRTLSPQLPTKRINTSLAKRAITVADKKRMAAIESSLAQTEPSRSSRSKVTTAPPSSASTTIKRSPRRLLREPTPESEEESTMEDDNEEVLRVNPVIPGDAVESTTSKKKQTSSTAVSVEGVSREFDPQTKVISFDALKNAMTSDVNGKTVPSTTTADASRLANGVDAKSALDTANSKQREESTVAAPTPTLTDSADTRTDGNVDKIVEKLKVCLRYFLPPDWPMQKDRIHTLTETELAAFPLEDFFDRYEQGLRALLSNFQQETQLFSDALQALRKDVVSLLDKTAPELQASTQDGEAIDQLLRDYVGNYN